MKNIVRVNARELKSLDDNKFTPKPVYQTDEMKVVLAYFKPGQFIPVHSPQVDVVLCVLEGEAEIIAGDEQVLAKKDDLIIIPKGEKRGVKALSELTLLHVVQPPPGEADHKEVHQRLAEGKFD
ncbi:cupin domain-containing protein [Thermodesulfobacteriota bacterium]